MYKLDRSHTMRIRERVLFSPYIVFDQPLLHPEYVPDACAQFAAECLAKEEMFTVVLIFAFSSPEMAKNNNYDLGRCLLTRDGKGLIGNGKTLDGATDDRKWIACYDPSPWKDDEYIDVSFYAV